MHHVPLFMAMRLRMKAGFLGLAFLLSMIGSLSVQAATITVGGGESITTKLASASPGDVLQFIHPGPFNENVVVNTPVSFTSALNPLPVINGLVDVQVSGASFQGIRFTNNSGSGIQIITDNVSTNIQGCDISGNSGAGIYIDAAAVTLTVNACAIYNNGSVLSPGIIRSGIEVNRPANGSGIIRTGPTISILNSQLSDQDRSVFYRGVQYGNDNRIVSAGNIDGQMTIDGCTITDNLANSLNINSNGRLVWLDETHGTDVIIQNTTLTDRFTTTDDWGFGCLYLQVNNADVLLENVITSGSWDAVTLQGQPINTSNNIVIRNSQFNQFGALFQIRKQQGNLLIENCLFDLSLQEGSGLRFTGFTDAELARIQAGPDFGPNAGISLARPFNVTVDGCDLLGSPVNSVFLNDGWIDANILIDDCFVDSNGATIFRLDRVPRAATAPGNHSVTLTVSNSTINNDTLSTKLLSTATNVRDATVEFIDNEINLLGKIASFETAQSRSILDMNHNFINLLDANTLVTQAGSTISESTLTFQKNTFAGLQGGLVNIDPGSDVDVEARLNIFYGWGGNLLANSGPGVTTEEFNVFIPTGVGQSIGIPMSPNSVTTSDPNEVFCNLNPLNYLEYLRVKQTGPAYLIDGLNNAGFFEGCPEPLASNENWSIYD